MKSKSQRGQALVIIVFSIIGLVAITGLAVDGGLAFSDRRNAQNAADNAAVAGAMAKIKAQKQGLNPDETFAALSVAALDMAGTNGYTSDLVSSTVEVYTCDMTESSCGSYYAGKADYVQVIITSYLNTYFSKVIGITQITNRVQAVALARASGDLYDGNNIIALSPTCKEPGSFIVGGNTTVDLMNQDGTTGGLYVNTDASQCGFACNSTAGTITGDITTAGSDLVLSEHCEANITPGTPATNGEQWDFPVTLSDLDIDTPPECTSPVGSYKNYDGTYTGADGAYLGQKITVLKPGWYDDFPPQQLISEGKLYDTILMEPGTYCVDHVIKLTDQNLWLIGKDVTFFIRAGYDFNINGGKVTLDAPDSGPYAGYLMIVEPNYGSPIYSSIQPENCVINGNSDNTYEGAIFAPYCNITINGTTEATGINSQIIGYTIKIDGGGDVTFTYDASKNPTLKATIGLLK